MEREDREMMTTIAETEGGVSLSELVTGLTTRRCHHETTKCPHDPPQMMTTIAETEGGVSFSELVTGLTTRRCHHETAKCPHDPPQMMTAVEETGGCVLLSELVTGVTTRQCCCAPPIPSAPPFQLPSQTEQIKSPQEVTLEGDGKPSAVVIVTTKGITTATHIG